MSHIGEEGFGTWSEIGHSTLDVIRDQQRADGASTSASEGYITAEDGGGYFTAESHVGDGSDDDDEDGGVSFDARLVLSE